MLSPIGGRSAGRLLAKRGLSTYKAEPSYRAFASALLRKPRAISDYPFAVLLTPVAGPLTRGKPLISLISRQGKKPTGRPALAQAPQLSCEALQVGSVCIERSRRPTEMDPRHPCRILHLPVELLGLQALRLPVAYLRSGHVHRGGCDRTLGPAHARKNRPEVFPLIWIGHG